MAKNTEQATKLGKTGTRPKTELPPPDLAPLGKRMEKLSRTLDDLVKGDPKRAGAFDYAKEFNGEVQDLEKLLKKFPTEDAQKIAQRLDEQMAAIQRQTDKVRKAANDLKALEDTKPPEGLGGKEKGAWFKQKNAETQRLKNDLEQASGDLKRQAGDLQGDLYRAQAEAAGVKLQKVAPGEKPPGYVEDPHRATREARTKYEVPPKKNVAHGELDRGGKTESLDTATSGTGKGSVPERDFSYQNESKVLHKEGQSTVTRAHDSEVQLLEKAKKMLASDPNQAGKLRIFTEYAPCPSCQRVFARFKQQHPNVQVEVYYTTEY